MLVPFYKPSIGPEEIQEVVETLQTGWLTTGPKTKKFEAAFAHYLQQRHAVAVNSCTAALHLALEAIGVKAGDTVVVPTMTFAATAEVVRYLGARPLLVDCREVDLNMDVADAERRIEAAIAEGQNVTAIIPVHYGGQVGDMAGILRLAHRYNLKIIEDAAHCCPAYYRYPPDESLTEPGGGSVRPKPLGPAGARGEGAPVRPKPGTEESTNGGALVRPKLPEGPPHAGRTLTQSEGQGEGWLPVGAEAEISCYSFYANKTITTGEGGMACTNNDAYADRMRIMSLHGISRDAWKRYTGEGAWYYEILAPGFKYNLTDIASAIGLHQLRKADAFHQRRIEIAAHYDALLGDMDELILPKEQPGRIHSWHLFAIRLKLDRIKLDRAQFIAEMQKAGIGCSVHWMPLHMHPYYRKTYGYRPEDLPSARAIYPGLLTLPLYPEMGEGDIALVTSTVRKILRAL